MPLDVLTFTMASESAEWRAQSRVLRLSCLSSVW
jgi:hypothetical protein